MDTKFCSLWQHKARVNQDKTETQKGVKIPYQSFIPLQHLNEPSNENPSLPSNFIHPWGNTEPPNNNTTPLEVNADEVENNPVSTNGDTITRSG